jgi:hypothetical protein
VCATIGIALLDHALFRSPDRIGRHQCEKQNANNHEMQLHDDPLSAPPTCSFIYNAVSMIAGIVPMLVIVLLRDCKSHGGATGREMSQSGRGFVSLADATPPQRASVLHCCRNSNRGASTSELQSLDLRLEARAKDRGI